MEEHVIKIRVFVHVPLPSVARTVKITWVVSLVDCILVKMVAYVKLQGIVFALLDIKKLLVKHSLGVL